MKLFDQAELANLSEEDVETYEESLKHMRDYTNTIESAERRGEKKGLVKGEKRGFVKGKNEGKIEGKLEGKLEGKIEGKLEIAKELFSKGFDLNLIQEITGLSKAKLEQIAKKTADD